NYNRARNEIQSNGKYWQEAKAAGITASNVYDYQVGIEYKRNDIVAKGERVFDKMSNASNAIEMSPRLAEYICAREAGLSVQEALLQAQDVTTNFGRGGTFAKTLNSTIMPFLNPSIQGFSKMVRAYMGEDGKKAWITLIIKSLLLGAGASVLNDLLNGDDEEYENLSDSVKENNYVLALGDGDFLKIPKGRVFSVFGSAFLRGRRYAEGDEKAWEGYVKSILSAVTPVDNITRTIFSPITDIQTNTTWYGGKIEGQKWDDTAPKDRYDESTSKISIWLGQVFDYSPIKINYLLEQYTGIVGDLVLPATSAQSSGSGSVNAVITQNMLSNATTNSKWSGKFYDAIEDYTYKKTAGDVQAKGVVKYLTAINKQVSEMYNDKRKVQADTTLSEKERLTQAKILQATINTLIQETLGNVDYLYNELGKYNLSNDDSDESTKAFNNAYRDCMRTIIGAEYALSTYNSDVYAKAKQLNTLGIGYEMYYDYYFDTKGLTTERDENGNVIYTSKSKVLAYTNQQNLPTLQKIILLMSKGYTVADGDIKGVSAKRAKKMVAQYISSLKVSREEKTALAKMLGLTVKNGKIYYN
ncbi:MAG: LPD38 domain-containing protein, partial [Acutalibacteraceae bacterium]|nr:LPD38 domain-containing protein [Acutalibacteraceae bacterium]